MCHYLKRIKWCNHWELSLNANYIDHAAAAAVPGCKCCWLGTVLDVPTLSVLPGIAVISAFKGVPGWPSKTIITHQELSWHCLQQSSESQTISICNWTQRLFSQDFWSQSHCLAPWKWLLALDAKEKIMPFTITFIVSLLRLTNSARLILCFTYC